MSMESALLFYRRLASLPHHDDPLTQLPELVQLFATATGALVGRLELTGIGDWTCANDVETPNPEHRLSVPVGSLGTLALRGKATPFTELDREDARTFAKQLLLVGPALMNATMKETFLEWRRRLIASRLRRRDWNVARVARELQVARSHLNEMILELGLRRGE